MQCTLLFSSYHRPKHCYLQWQNTNITNTKTPSRVSHGLFNLSATWPEFLHFWTKTERRLLRNAHFEKLHHSFGNMLDILTVKIFKREPTGIKFLLTEISGAPIHFSFWMLLLGATGSRKAQGELLRDQITPRVPDCNKLIWTESTKKLKTPSNNFAKHITFQRLELWSLQLWKSLCFITDKTMWLLIISQLVRLFKLQFVVKLIWWLGLQLHLAKPRTNQGQGLKWNASNQFWICILTIPTYLII